MFLNLAHELSRQRILVASSTTGLFANFTLTGLVAGDVIHVIGTPGQSADNVQLPYVGGVGFTAVPTPEPSTYAMLFAGLGALALLACARRTA